MNERLNKKMSNLRRGTRSSSDKTPKVPKRSKARNTSGQENKKRRLNSSPVNLSEFMIQQLPVASNEEGVEKEGVSAENDQNKEDGSEVKN